MFKGKISLWAAVLISAFLLTSAINYLFYTSDVTANVDISYDDNFANAATNRRFGDYQLICVNGESDLIITEHKDKSIDGYTKYENYIKSPLVAFAKGVRQEKTGFIQGHGSRNIFKIDLNQVLCGIENDSTWEELGFDNYIVSGPVTLYIPNEHVAYYNDVVELFYLTLNDGIIPDDNERQALSGRVKTILSKCHKVADPVGVMVDEYHDETKESKIVIAPEYVIKRAPNSEIGEGYMDSSQFRPVYFFDTLYLTADVYVKDDLASDSYPICFVKNMKNDKAFTKKTGWRVSNSTYSLSEISDAIDNN